MRINLFDSRNTKVSDTVTVQRDTSEVTVKKNNKYCRCCGSNPMSIRLQATNPSKSRGVTDILYVGRVNKQDILICPRCVATSNPLLQYGGNPVLCFDNDREKYIGDSNKLENTRGVYEQEDGYF